MNTTDFAALIVPGKLTNIWGKSGAGKTSLALDLALSKLIETEGKILYITDDPIAVTSKLAPILKSKKSDEPLRKLVNDNFFLIRSLKFKDQGEIVMQIPFAFLPGQKIRDSQDFKNFVGTGENDLNEMIISSLNRYVPPSMVVIDEFTRQYKRESIQVDDLARLNLNLVTQLGFLKNVAVERCIPIVITSATRTINTAIDGDEEMKFIEVPIASDAIDYYVDINVQLQWTGHAGERRITTILANESGGRLDHLININEINNHIAGGKHR